VSGSADRQLWLDPMEKDVFNHDRSARSINNRDVFRFFRRRPGTGGHHWSANCAGTGMDATENTADGYSNGS
jgi:hypothetical protein